LLASALSSFASAGSPELQPPPKARADPSIKLTVSPSALLLARAYHGREGDRPAFDGLVLK
jgi:hypothetical protein